MRVFLTGATGYIGSAVGQAFRRAGHEVVGLIRGGEGARSLARDEIQGAIGDLRQPESYQGIAAECDVLIHCAADYAGDWAASDRRTMETLVAAARSGGKRATVVFTSGSWIYGSRRGEAVVESTPVAPLHIGAHRPAVEQLVLRADGVRGIAIRPANVYGKREGMLAAWLAAAHDARPLVVAGDGANHWPMVHVDDLAQGYLAAAESRSAGAIFHFADRESPTVRELIDAISRAADFHGKVEYLPLPDATRTMGANAEVVALDLRLDTTKAARVLGWHSRHDGFVADAAVYTEAWKAWHGMPVNSRRERALTGTTR